MAAGTGYGSVARPYVEHPVERIVEVHWGGGPIVLVTNTGNYAGAGAGPLFLIDLDDPFGGHVGSHSYSANEEITKERLTEFRFYSPGLPSFVFRWPGMAQIDRAGDQRIAELISILELERFHTFPEPPALSNLVPNIYPDFPEVFSATMDWPTFHNRLLNTTIHGGQIYNVFHGDPSILGPPAWYYLLWVFGFFGTTETDAGRGADGGAIAGAGTGTGGCSVNMGRVRRHFSIERRPDLINMASGEEKANRIKVVQPATAASGPVSAGYIPSPGLFPDVVIKAYSGGTWKVNAALTGVENTGGTVLWEHTVTRLPWSTSDQELFRFDKAGPI